MTKINLNDTFSLIPYDPLRKSQQKQRKILATHLIRRYRRETQRKERDGGKACYINQYCTILFDIRTDTKLKKQHPKPLCLEQHSQLPSQLLTETDTLSNTSSDHQFNDTNIYSDMNIDMTQYGSLFVPNPVQDSMSETDNAIDDYLTTDDNFNSQFAFNYTANVDDELWSEILTSAGVHNSEY